MGKLQSNLYPEMNVFLGGLEMALSDLSDLGVLPKRDLKFFLLHLNEVTKMQTIEYIGANKLFFVDEEVGKICKKKLLRINVKVISLYDDSVGVFSEFGNPKINQAISILWLVAKNYIKNHPEEDQKKDFFWQRITEEVRIFEKILQLKNPCICEICKIISRNKRDSFLTESTKRLN